MKDTKNITFLSFQCAPGRAVSALWASSCFIPATTLWHRYSTVPILQTRKLRFSNLHSLTIIGRLCHLPCFACLTIRLDHPSHSARYLFHKIGVSIIALSPAAATFFKGGFLQLLSSQAYPGQAAASHSRHLHNKFIFNTEVLRWLLKVKYVIGILRGSAILAALTWENRASGAWLQGALL